MLVGTSIYLKQAWSVSQLVQFLKDVKFFESNIWRTDQVSKSSSNEENLARTFCFNMVLLENDQFLSRLTLMFDRTRTSGHVDIVMKRYDGRTKPVPREASTSSKSGKKQQPKAAAPPPSATQGKARTESTSHDGSEYMCLIRATTKNQKISTVVHARDVNKFQLAYCQLLKNNIDGLKRQKKAKLKKAAA